MLRLWVLVFLRKSFVALIKVMGKLFLMKLFTKDCDGFLAQAWMGSLDCNSIFKLTGRSIVVLM